MRWRFVDSGLVGPAMASAMDEAILEARGQGLVPDTFHLYRRNAPAISLGRFDRVDMSVNREATARLGVSLVRRMSGGTAIYTDPGHLVYSVAVARGSMPESPQDAFRIICRGVVLALRELGVEAVFRPVNDVLVGDRKISGSAQVRRRGIMLQHGTLMVHTDYERMFAVLRGKRPRSGLTSLAEELEDVPSMETVVQAMERGFSEALAADMVREGLSAAEEEEAERLVRTIYGRDEHTFIY